MTPLAALHALGLDLHDVASMKYWLLVGIDEANRELIESFNR